MSRRLSPTLLVIVVVGTLLTVRWAIMDQNDLDDIDRFEAVTDVRIGPETSFFASGLNGDGAAFAAIALDPLGNDIGGILRVRSFRYLRVGYAWLAALVTLGQEEFVLAGLAAIGFASAGVIAWVAARLNERRGVWAWLLIANPALIIGVLGATAEPLALALFAVAVYSGSAMAGLAVAVVRPTYLVALAGWPRVFLGGLAISVLGKIYWSWHFEESLITGGFTLTWPLGGIIGTPSSIGWALVLAAMATVVVGVVHRDWSWVVAGAFALCLGEVVFDTPTNALRAAGYLPVLWAFGPRFVSVGGLRGLFAFGRRSELMARDLAD